MVGDAWPSDKVVSSDTDCTPVKLDLQIKELVIISFFTVKTRIQDKEGIPYWKHDKMNQLVFNIYYLKILHMNIQLKYMENEKRSISFPICFFFIL